MTVAELHALEVPQIDWVREWRLEALVRAGYDEDLAIEIAFHRELDLTTRPSCPAECPRARQHGFSLEAGEGTRTLDLRLGKPTLYQLSYARVRASV